MSTHLGHWRRHTDNDRICWLTLDRADSSANTLSHAVVDELDAQLTQLRAEQPQPRGLVIKSGKSNGFILGADVKEFSEIDTAARGVELAGRGQAVIARIEALSIPTVAAIDGFALGGGLELALACDYRVAVKGYERNLGLPEVQLGIHPGFGGTVRSVDLLGAPLALDLMLTGRLLSPAEAVAQGLVDRVVAREDLDRAAVEMINAAKPRHRAAWHLRLLSSAPVRPFLGRSIAARIRRRARRAHYPAPYAILDLWLRHGGRGATAYRAEVESIGHLLVTRTSKNLVRMFELRERLRNLAPKAAATQRVHVVGAGTMGGDIAAWCALRGLSVTVQDRAQEYVEPALRRARELFQKRLREPGAADAAGARLVVDLSAAQVGSADVVIEAIIEKLEAKQSLLRELEPKLKDDAVIATNTSSIQLEEISPALRVPGRFVGLHFFNPVASLPLVEVIQGKDTDAATMSKALAFVTQIGKLPLPCRSAPGFVVNRILTPYMLEALRAHEDGHSFETIDEAAKSFGMPVGPVELADQVGLDVALHVAEILSKVLGAEPPQQLRDKVAAKELGVKTGRGFYVYGANGRPEKSRDVKPPDAELVDRLILPMVNEAVACLDEDVVADADLLDAGVVFGTGFAPFTGGPMNYAKERGFREVHAKLEELSKRYGTRFAPHPGWRRFVDPA